MSPDLPSGSLVVVAHGSARACRRRDHRAARKAVAPRGDDGAMAEDPRARPDTRHRRAEPARRAAQHFTDQQGWRRVDSVLRFAFQKADFGCLGARRNPWLV